MPALAHLPPVVPGVENFGAQIEPVLHTGFQQREGMRGGKGREGMRKGEGGNANFFSEKRCRNCKCLSSRGHVVGIPG